MDDLATWDLATARDRLAAGAVRSIDLVHAARRRIAALDPLINAVIALAPDAEERADIADAARAAGDALGPLHGIPILVKDNLDTGDGMATTAGSLALAGSHAARDAAVVARLRAAGAIVLGKTNLSEWANFRSTRSTSGWSSLGGQTRNPHCLERTPGGSSSGSGAAVAAGYVTAAIGTETDGSIVNPAAMNGIVGLKPTVGLVSRAGIVPIAASQDTAGPMTRSVRDAALMLNAIAGSDPADPASVEADLRRAPDYAAGLAPDGLRGRRIGLITNYCGHHADVDAVVADAVRATRAAGGTVVDLALASLDTVRPLEIELMLYEFKAGLNAYLAGRGPDSPIRDLEALIAFNRAHAEAVMPHFRQELLERAAEKGPLSEPAYRDLRRRCRRMTRDAGIDAVLAEYEVQAIMAPSAGPAWRIDWLCGDNRGIASSMPAAVAGYPNIAVPAGFARGLPIDISFIASAWQEPVLLQIAHAFEQTIQARRAPRFARDQP